MEHFQQVTNISKQLEELEMLQSIYPEPGELVVHDRTVIADARKFVEANGNTGVVLRKISFALQVSSVEVKFTAICELPLDYPEESPDIFIRVDTLHRGNQRQLNEDLEEFILETERGEVCVLNAIQWVQENIENYKHVEEAAIPIKVEGMKDEKSKLEKFSRLWILSHHIYSKFKRRDILDWSSELKLRGFSLPGKPGIVCVEGPTLDAEEFWNRLRRLNWKKISCKHREDFPFPDVKWKPKNLEERRKGYCFENFEELNFNARGFGTGREYHMDLGMLQKFLEEKGFTDIFKILLGVEGKASTKQD
ncbi:RWD domain-containing protein 2B [Holothuria leucospilota]|uniref:RWD domain-containing protein 2B n=1 Tax=Holothuria leucospilota TaxID=206669 RepID=A0A9Q1BKT0_HOLLE|nr:RWD domain-containing protein 2B [Holothuria leucospilota]